jgi:hypothetical protein
MLSAFLDTVAVLGLLASVVAHYRVAVGGRAACPPDIPPEVHLR